MNNLVPFTKFITTSDDFNESAYAITDEQKTPKGFVFGRDAFLSFLTQIDDKFEKVGGVSKKTFDNPAGQLIDLIEERLFVKEEFIDKMKIDLEKNSTAWIPLSQISQILHA